MGKFRVLILLVIFIGCIAIGAFAAENVIKPVIATYAPPATPAPELSSSYNYIVLYVDNLSKDQPTLKAIWLAYVTLWENPEADLQPTVMFKPIFPTPQTESPAFNLKSLFSLTADRRPSPKFLKALNGVIEDYEGYFIVDTSGIDLVFTQLTGSIPDHAPALTKSNALEVVRRQAQSLENLCSGLNNLPAADQRPAFDISDLTPRHMRTNLELDDAYSLWERISHASGVQCNVLNRP